MGMLWLASGCELVQLMCPAERCLVVRLQEYQVLYVSYDNGIRSELMIHVQRPLSLLVLCSIDRLI